MPLFITDKNTLKTSRGLSREQARQEALHRRDGRKPELIYFLHIPKCGGTSVAHLWRSAYPGCVVEPNLNTASDIKHCRLREVDDIFDVSFSIVRQPVTWYESWWRYVQSPKVTDRPETRDAQGKPNFDTWIGEGVWHPLRRIAACHDTNFARFIENVIETAPGFVSDMYDEYLGFRTGRITVDHLIRLETMYTDFTSFCETYGFATPREPKHENKTKDLGQVIWPLELKKEVERLEADAINYFNYT